MTMLIGEICIVASLALIFFFSTVTPSNPIMIPVALVGIGGLIDVIANLVELLF